MYGHVVLHALISGIILSKTTCHDSFLLKKIPDFGVGPGRGHHAGFALVVKLIIDKLPWGIVEFDL